MQVVDVMVQAVDTIVQERARALGVGVGGLQGLMN